MEKPNVGMPVTDDQWLDGDVCLYHWPESVLYKLSTDQQVYQTESDLGWGIAYYYWLVLTLLSFATCLLVFLVIVRIHYDYSIAIVMP